MSKTFNNTKENSYWLIQKKNSRMQTERQHENKKNNANK